MNVSNLENSKKLYELSGLRGTYLVYDEHGELLAPTGENQSYRCPAYDAGYLLRKLPSMKENMYLYLTAGQDDTWAATYRFTDEFRDGILIADTPEDCLALLAIKLFEEGVL